MIILERDPGAYDLVRRLLGHSELSTTVDAYSGMETLRATQWFGEAIRLIPVDGALQIELVGALAGILALGKGERPGHRSLRQTTLVAGVGFEPTTFRL